MNEPPKNEIKPNKPQTPTRWLGLGVAASALVLGLLAHVWLNGALQPNGQNQSGFAHTLRQWLGFAPYPLAGYTLHTPSGTPLDLQALQGKPVVINLWATWCPPCVEEMPELSGLYPTLQANGVEMLGIALDQAANVQQFLRTTPVDYPIVLAGNMGFELQRLLGNSTQGVPYTVILDAKGVQLFAKAGRIHPHEIEAALNFTSKN